MTSIDEMVIFPIYIDIFTLMIFMADVLAGCKLDRVG
jgi:hypothetical protein